MRIAHPPKKEPNSTVKPCLTLIGRRRNDRFRVDLDATQIWLPCALFTALVKLIVAIVKTDTGLAKFPCLTIHRLRKVLGKHGRLLIVNGSGEEYRVTITTAEIANRVWITQCFAELVDLHVVTVEDAELLREACGPCTLGNDDDSSGGRHFRKSSGKGKEIKRKPSGN